LSRFESKTVGDFEFIFAQMDLKQGFRSLH